MNGNRFKYGVDVVFAGHVHNQERTLPVRNSTFMPSAVANQTDPHVDAGAPVYIVSGNPGNAEETNFFGRQLDPWTAWRSYSYGYAHLVADDASDRGRGEPARGVTHTAHTQHVHRADIQICVRETWQCAVLDGCLAG